MTFDDLRNLAHTLAKDIHEYDVDLLESNARFTSRLEALSERAFDLSVALQNYSPLPVLPVPRPGSSN